LTQEGQTRCTDGTIPLFAHDDFGNPLYKDIGKVILETYRKTGKVDLIDLVDSLGEREQSVVAELSLKEESFGNLLESLKDCIRQIKKNRIRRMQASLTRKIKEAQESRDEGEIRDLHKRKIELILQEKNLNSNIGSLLTLWNFEHRREDINGKETENW